MRPVLNDELRVRHVLDAISEIESYLKGISLDIFLSNSEKRFATIKQLRLTELQQFWKIFVSGRCGFSEEGARCLFVSSRFTLIFGPVLQISPHRSQHLAALP